MIKKWPYLLSSTLILSISAITHASEFTLTEAMKMALNNFNPKFIAWETRHYSDTIQKDAAKNQRTPYSLILDVNKDLKADVILDGHDHKNRLLICLLSTPKGYKNIVINRQGLPGTKEIRLNYYLWPNKTGTGFTIAYPQASDAQGNLIEDGYITNYSFEGGQFHATHQVL